MKSQLNSGHLRSLLGSFTEQLSLTFLERRGKLNNHKSSLLEELQDVIAELTHREKDLLTSVEIALSALDTNDKLQRKLEKSRDALNQAQEKIHHQSIDIKTLQDSLLQAEYRYENLNKTLVETEELMLENSAELNRMVRQRFYEASKMPDEEVEAMKRDYKRQIEALHKKKWETEREKTNLQELLNAQEGAISDYQEKNRKLEAKVGKLNEIIKDLEKEKTKLTEKNEKIETNIRILGSCYERIKAQNEKLEEELSLSNVKQETPQKTFHSLSLQSELESLNESVEFTPHTQEDESLEDILYLSPEGKCKTPQTRASSMNSYFKLFSTDQNQGIGISPQRLQRKRPPEEYFSLAVQAVKMNSPHIDKIISVPASDLYDSALKQGIPFHKWHIWIESQLNSIYVQTLYKKNNKSIWKRYSKKICLGL